MMVDLTEQKIKEEEAGCLTLFIAMILLVLSPFIGMAFESCDPVKAKTTAEQIKIAQDSWKANSGQCHTFSRPTNAR